MKRYYEVMLVLCGLLCLPGCANNNRLSMEKSAAEHNEEKSFESVRNVPEGEAFSAPSDHFEKSTEAAAANEEKGYQLSPPSAEEKEAQADCLHIMELYADTYAKSDKGNTINTVLAEDILLTLQRQAAAEGSPVEVNVPYADLENYENMDHFLKESEAGHAGECTMYTIHIDGSLGRSKFFFDGKDMYLAAAHAVWNKQNEPVYSHMSYNRIEQWKYTEKGWFGYELCAPKPPEVTEIVDSSCLIRVLPYEEELRQLSRRCVFGIGYGMGNLLDADWDEHHMEKLDFNSLFPLLYQMQQKERFVYGDYRDGVPENEFEQMIMQYLPVDVKTLRNYAVYNAETGTYGCEPMGCFTYTPDFLGTSLPEVTAVRENQDGTVTLTVDAVCDMVICNDAVITSELTVKFMKDGSFQYIKNKVIKDHISIIESGKE